MSFGRSVCSQVFRRTRARNNERRDEGRKMEDDKGDQDRKRGTRKERMHEHNSGLHTAMRHSCVIAFTRSEQKKHSFGVQCARSKTFK